MIYKLEGKLKKPNLVIKYLVMALKSIFLAFLLTIVVALIIGFRPVRVISNSMTPTLYKGDVIIIYKPKQNEFKVGDILTFTSGSTNVTHRIIEITEEGYFVTQGDANDSPDGNEVTYNKTTSKPYVVGKTYYMFRGALSWFTYVPNLLALLAAVVLLSQINSSTKELLEKNAQYL